MAGYERRDIRSAPIIGAGVAIVAIAVLTFVAMWRLLGGYDAGLARRSPAANPLRAEYGRTRAPEPRLQVDPAGDLRALRAEEQAVLDGYAWVDRPAGRVRIPIARAMELVVQERRQ